MRIIVSIAALFWLLVAARPILQPLAIGVLIWLMLGASVRRLMELLPASWRRSRTVGRGIGVLVFVVILCGIGLAVAASIADLRQNLPVYEENLDNLIAAAGAWVGVNEAVRFADLLSEINMRDLALNLAGSTAAYLTVLFMVVIYVLFIFLEAQLFDPKVSAVAGTRAREARIRQFLRAARSGIDDFLSVQFLVGVLQAGATFIVLKIVGTEAPMLWAMAIFAFSFIPTIGSLFGIAVPAAMTLLQFGTVEPFLVVLVTLGIVQVSCSNILLPRLMSRSLNLSPLVVLFAVFIGGAMWGVVGALISVPVVTIVAIVCAMNPELRVFALILSRDGQLPPLAVDADTDAVGRPLAESSLDDHHNAPGRSR